MKILIADDDPQFLKALRITLRSQGYEIVTASDGVQCISAAVEHHPDLMVLDLGMPKMDGMGVIQGVRGWTDAPILVVSGRTDAREKVAALDAGADDYVTKPVSIDELLARIRALARRIPQKPLPRSVTSSPRGQSAFLESGIRCNWWSITKARLPFSVVSSSIVSPSRSPCLSVRWRRRAAS